MTRKHFQDLADILRTTKPGASLPENDKAPALRQWEKMQGEILAFCVRHNSNFDKARFLTAINK